MSKRKRGAIDEDDTGDPRADPKARGVIKEPLKSERAASGRATCVDCGKNISVDSWRWGLKYAGNPLQEPVVPLYGTHPMYMWLHSGGCGLAYYRLLDEDCPAKRTCHACQDIPGDVGELRLLCGGNAKGKKIRSHPFHFRCWKQALKVNGLLVDPKEIGKHKRRGLCWSDLTSDEQQLVKNDFS